MIFFLKQSLQDNIKIFNKKKYNIKIIQRKYLSLNYYRSFSSIVCTTLVLFFLGPGTTLLQNLQAYNILKQCYRAVLTN